MPLQYVGTSLWTWAATTGLTLAILICVALLIPRIGRLIVRWSTIKLAEREIEKGESVDPEARKGQLALLGAMVYIGEAIAFFFVGIQILKQFGLSTTGAAVPATVVSAAVAFGAQRIIADFLAGFFIITERQFGVGDWVVFNTSSSVKVEGEVTGITLRATTLRTVEGQEATVPNSAPSVVINASSGWARAVMDMPIPLTAAANTEDLNTLFEDCVNRTIATPEIRSLVSSEPDAVKILPAVELISPTATGVPWCLKYRIMIRVEPGQQWNVERAIRASVMNEMWKSYTASSIDSMSQHIPGLEGWNAKDSVLTDDPRSGSASAPSAHKTASPHTINITPQRNLPYSGTTDDETEVLRAQMPQKKDSRHANGNSHTETTGAATNTAPNSTTPSRAQSDEPSSSGKHASETKTDLPQISIPTDSSGATNATTATQAQPTLENGEENQSKRTDLPGTESSSDSEDSIKSDTKTQVEREAEDATQHGLFRKEHYNSGIARLLSIGGRCRPSTTALFLILMLLLVLRGMTVDGGNGRTGILAPPHSTSTSSTPTTSTPSQTRPTSTQPTTTTPESQEPTSTDTTRTTQNPTNTNQTTTVPSAEPTTQGNTRTTGTTTETTTTTNNNPLNLGQQQTATEPTSTMAP